MRWLFSDSLSTTFPSTQKTSLEHSWCVGRSNQLPPPPNRQTSHLPRQPLRKRLRTQKEQTPKIHKSLGWRKHPRRPHNPLLRRLWKTSRWYPRRSTFYARVPSWPCEIRAAQDRGIRVPGIGIAVLFHVWAGRGESVDDSEGDKGASGRGGDSYGFWEEFCVWGDYEVWGFEGVGEWGCG